MARKANPGTPRSSDQPSSCKDSASAPPSGEEYKVGPGRPPKEFQWKKGQSGNPKGAKRKQPSLLPDLKKIVLSALNKKVKMRDGERERHLTRFETGVEQLTVQFARGTSPRVATSSSSWKNWGSNCRNRARGPTKPSPPIVRPSSTPMSSGGRKRRTPLRRPLSSPLRSCWTTTRQTNPRIPTKGDEYDFRDNPEPES